MAFHSSLTVPNAMMSASPVKLTRRSRKSEHRPFHFCRGHEISCPSNGLKRHAFRAEKADRADFGENFRLTLPGAAALLREVPRHVGEGEFRTVMAISTTAAAAGAGQREDQPVEAASIALFAPAARPGDGARILFIQRAHPPLHGLWTLPGGKLEPGESAAEAVVRELFEETGLATQAPLFVRRHLAGREGRRFALSVFAARHRVATPTPSEEVADWAWLGIEALAERRCTPGLAEVVAACAARLAESHG